MTDERDQLSQSLLAAVVAADNAEYQPPVGEDSDENWWRYIIAKAVIPTVIRWLPPVGPSFPQWYKLKKIEERRILVAERDGLQARIDAANLIVSQAIDEGLPADEALRMLDRALSGKTARALQGDQPAERGDDGDGFRCCIGPFADGRHARYCRQRCQDCQGDPDGPDRCKCRDVAARATAVADALAAEPEVFREDIEGTPGGGRP